MSSIYEIYIHNDGSIFHWANIVWKFVMIEKSTPQIINALRQNEILVFGSLNFILYESLIDISYEKSWRSHEMNFSPKSH